MTDNNRQLDRRQILGGLLPLLAGLPLLANAQTELTDLAKIRASGVLKVAVYKDNAPFSDGPANDVKGLDVSIAAALARQLNLKLSLLPFDAGENMNDDLRNMVWHVMLQVPGDKYLMARNRQVLILAPYMRQSLVLVFDTTRIADVSSPDDLKGFQLAAERGAGGTSALMGYNGGLLRAQVGIHNTGTQAVQAMLDGKAVAAYVTRAQAESVLSRAEVKPGQYRMAQLTLSGLPDNGWPVGMAIKAENKELGIALETALQSIRSSGELLAIFKQHGMTLTAP